MVFFPEGCDYIGESIAESRALAEPLDGSLMSEYKKLAQTHGVWLSIGGFHEIKNKDDPKVCVSVSFYILDLEFRL